MHGRGLGRAGQNDRGAAGRRQGCGGPPDPHGSLIVPTRRRGARVARDGRLQPAHQAREIGRADRQMIIGLGAGEARRRGGGVQGQEIARLSRSSPGLDPVARRAELVRSGVEEVAVERHDELGPVEAPAGLQLASVGRLRSGRGPARHRSMDVPFHLRKRLLQGRDLGQQRRRTQRPGQEPQTFAAIGLEDRETSDGRAAERVPGGNPGQVAHGLRAGRIVEIEDRGLGEDVRAASAPGMAVVPLHLERASVAGQDGWRRWRCRRAGSRWCRRAARRARSAPDCGRRAPRDRAGCPRPNRPIARPWRRTRPSAGRTGAGPARRPSGRPRETPSPGSRGRPASRPRPRGCATRPDRTPGRDGT